MNFEQITKHLLNGEKVKRKCWENKHFWFLNKNMLQNSAGEKPLVNKSQLEADDWMLYFEEKPFCLSDKVGYDSRYSGNIFFAEVQKFIKLIKEPLKNQIEVIAREEKNHVNIAVKFVCEMTLKNIDKLAGDLA